MEFFVLLIVIVLGYILYHIIQDVDNERITKEKYERKQIEEAAQKQREAEQQRRVELEALRRKEEKERLQKEEQRRKDIEHKRQKEERRKAYEEQIRLKEERLKEERLKEERLKKEREERERLLTKDERTILKYKESFRSLSVEEIEKTIYDTGVKYSEINLMLKALSDEKRRLVTELHQQKLNEKLVAKECQQRNERIKEHKKRFKGLSCEQIELIIYNPSNTSSVQEEMLEALTAKQKVAVKKAYDLRIQREKREERELSKYRKLFENLSVAEIEKTIYAEGVQHFASRLMLKSLPDDKKSEVLNLHHKKNQEKLEAKKEQERKDKLKKYKELFDSKTANEIAIYVYNKKFTEKKREEMLSVLSPQRRGAVTRARNIIIFREQEEKRLAEEAERKRLAEEAKRKRLAEEAERRRLAQEAERKRLAEEAERKRLAEEAERRRLVQEAERRRKEQEIQELNNLKDKISHWPNLSYWGDSLPYNYIINYFPTSSSIEATGSEWQDRRLIWNFKNDPNKTKNHEHENALDNIIPRIAEKLKQDFGDISLRKLTLVCIPASSNTKNIARFKEFSERLCNMMGMANAFNRIFILNEREATHDGGEYSKNYSLDSEYFKDRYVIIFDDLITRGRSMIVMKRDLEKCGAKVICGFSVGKTKHNRD